MGDLKSGESFTDRVYVQLRSNGLAATGLGTSLTCVIIDELGNRSNGSVSEIGNGWYKCTFTPDAEGIWATEWRLNQNYLIWIPFKIFKVGGGVLADVYTDVGNLITLVNTLDTVLDGTYDQVVDLGSQLTQIYQVAEEIEHHLHNYERWLGSTSGVAPADEDSLDAFSVTSSATAGQFGTPIAVFDGTDTPVQSGMTKFDVHRLLITNVSVNNEVFRLRFADNSDGDTSWADAVAAGRYTDLIVQVTNAGELVSPLHMIQKRLNTQGKIWVAVAKEGTGAGTVEFFVGIHEYSQ